MAFGAKTYFDGIGLRVGEDVALTGYDDEQRRSSRHYIRSPAIDDVAAAAFDILLGGISSKSRRKSNHLPASLVIRKSSVQGLRP